MSRSITQKYHFHLFKSRIFTTACTSKIGSSVSSVFFFLLFFLLTKKQRRRGCADLASNSVINRDAIPSRSTERSIPRVGLQAARQRRDLPPPSGGEG